MGYIRIYGLDVKDRKRGRNTPKSCAYRMRAYMARNYGADDRYQTTSGTLST